MPAYYLEPSAILKRYRRELGSDVVNALFDERTPDRHFITSYFSALEVSAVAARMLRGRLLRPAQYRRLLAQFLNDLASVRLLPLDDTLVDDAMHLLPNQPLRAPDALHFASALRAQRAIGTAELYMVTADREIAEAAREHSMAVIDPENPNALDLVRAIR